MASIVPVFTIKTDAYYGAPAGYPKVETTQHRIVYKHSPVSNSAIETCFRAVAFSFVLLAWRIARCFRCGKLGKLTYSQLLAEYW